MDGHQHRHITVPECPNCGAEQKAVADWDDESWYCFACKSAGNFEVSFTVTKGASVEGDESPNS